VPEPGHTRAVRVLILGGDGFCGWPTVLHLSSCGHDVTIVDNFARRRADEELDATSLTPIRPLVERLEAWRELSGDTIGFVELDVARDFDGLRTLLAEQRPDAVVHFAEQRAAPYSMKSARHKLYTVDNNVNATNNLLVALVDLAAKTHVVHLGTMGVYGYDTPSLTLPEGYLNVRMKTDEGSELEREILFPASPGSVYHMTKCQDQLLFAFYNANDGLPVTDLHQGIVWGTQTEQTRRDDRLINRFDYDGDYGTVLNRFIMQAAVGHPLTVHGTGGQTRAFIHLQDTVRCIQLAVEHPPAPGERVRIFNQMTEVHRVAELAALVAERTGATIELQENPRREAETNELAVDNRQLLELGLDPITLQDDLVSEVHEIAVRFADRCDWERIPARSRWVRHADENSQAALA
jgi:UDP-sulfoquinovose synthase